jgi:SAM-dependent methyltransferase
VNRDDRLDRYFAAIAAIGIHPRPARLRFYLEYLFDGVPLEGRTVLDIGAGDGAIGFYARAAGAASVVSLDPVGDGCNPGQNERFAALASRLRDPDMRLLPVRLQDFDAGGRTFDVLLLHNSINHLDEAACVALRRDPDARARYEAIGARLSRLARSGGALVVTDCSPHNLFVLLGLTHPLLPRIEWHKHQAPALWAGILARAGFGRARVRRRSPSALRRPGRILLGNALASFCIDSQFCLTMVRETPGAQAPP